LALLLFFLSFAIGVVRIDFSSVFVLSSLSDVSLIKTASIRKWMIHNQGQVDD